MKRLWEKDSSNKFVYNWLDLFFCWTGKQNHGFRNSECTERCMVTVLSLLVPLPTFPPTEQPVTSLFLMCPSRDIICYCFKHKQQATNGFALAVCPHWYSLAVIPCLYEGGSSSPPLSLVMFEGHNKWIFPVPCGHLGDLRSFAFTHIATVLNNWYFRLFFYLSMAAYLEEDCCYIVFP